MVMIRRALLALTAFLCLVAPAQAQKYSYAARTVDWTDGTVGTGVPYGITNMLPDYPTTENTAPYYASPGTPVATYPSGNDAKMRTTCLVANEGTYDPMLFPGMNMKGHEHTFFGHNAVTKNSTYQSLRTTGSSTCGGFLLNRSGYWHPSVRKTLTNGVAVSIKPNFYTIYYVNNNDAWAATTVQIPRGLTEIFGYDPSKPATSDWAAESTQGNARGLEAYGTNTPTFSCRTPGTGTGVNANGSNADSIIAGSAEQPYLRADNGNPTLTCAPNTEVQIRVSSPQCWDGFNLTSPTGREHVRVRRYDNAGFWTCPKNWYRIPSYQFLAAIPSTGPSDYKDWFLSSDREPGKPVRRDMTTFHVDTFFAWDYAVMKTFMRECLGVTIDGTAGTPRACDASTISPTVQMAAQAGTDNFTGKARFFPPIKRPRTSSTMIMKGH